MQPWRPFLLIVALALLLIACGPRSSDQAVGAPGTQPQAAAQNAGPTPPVRASAFPSAIASTNPTVVPSEPPGTCPVTQRQNPPFIPPPPYPDEPYDSFWYGTEALWTRLLDEGTWKLLPYHGGGYIQKVSWWQQGYDWRAEPKPKLTVTGRRLDAPAPPFVTSEATSGYTGYLKAFMLVGVNIPTLGCWEITGRYQGHELSFVVWVAP